ncbi:MAG: hypothetical protein Q7S73_02855 [bacterium]|nr:hypothetical protein [bacterium]
MEISDLLLNPQEKKRFEKHGIAVVKPGVTVRMLMDGGDRHSHLALVANHDQKDNAIILITNPNCPYAHYVLGEVMLELNKESRGYNKKYFEIEELVMSLKKDLVEEVKKLNYPGTWEYLNVIFG